MQKAVSYSQVETDLAEQLFKILVLNTQASNNASIIIDSLSQHFQCFFGKIDDYNGSVSYIKNLHCIVLLVSSVQNGWMPYIQKIKQCFPQIPLVVSIEERNQSQMSVLLETDIDDIICLQNESQSAICRIQQLLKYKKLSKLKQESFHNYCKENFIGQSQVFLQAIENIPLVSQSDSPVLICGETGVGKELCARAIHYIGTRSVMPFIPVNCAALHEHLFESELFGHVKGAYTGATSTRYGLIHAAEGGTLFLDEINTLSASAQVKLLRFLEEKQYLMLGSSEYKKANVRIIAASNVDLEIEVKEGRFREDFEYRINVLGITLPPLRERKEDIALIAQHYLEKCNSSASRARMYFAESALRRLFHWGWPGNVRELKNVIERSTVKCSSNILRENNIHINHKMQIKEILSLGSFQEAKALAVRDFEKTYLVRLLSGNNWNITGAAHQAHKDKKSFYRLLKKHDLT